MIVLVVGGIGTGKSSVMKILESLGANTIYADRINKELLNDKGYVDLLKDSFEGVVENDLVNTQKLRNLILNDDNARAKLNQLAHPKIFNRIKELTSKKENYFVEIPLFSQLPNDFIYDKICAVKAQENIRADRIAKRDNVSFTDAKKIISVQQEEEKVYDIADFIIQNNGDMQSLCSQVESVFDKCLKE